MISDPRDSVGRFSARAALYARYRPDYPAALFDYLTAQAGLGPGCTVADIGAGTGIFTRHLSERGATVHLVEPNADMRAHAVEALGQRGNVSFHATPAEATGLPDHSLDLITAAQAAHWFEPAGIHVEWRRILRPGGRVALVWNRAPDDDPYYAAYQSRVALRFHLRDDARHGFRRSSHIEDVTRLFGYLAPTITFANPRRVDRETYVGAAFSGSYAPPKGHPNHEPMHDAVNAVFDEFADGDGLLTFSFETLLVLGHLKPA